MTDDRDRGAAAVEFALLLPILVLLLTAIVDYGLWFSDSISVRQGAREGVRQAAVAQYAGCSAGDEADKTACIVADRTGNLGGDLAVHVYSPGNWAEGSKVVVCVAIKETGITGLTPLPHGGTLRTKATTRIEVDQASAGSATYDDDDDPTGQNWTPWC